MRRYLFLAIFFVAQAAFAATPITCTALQALGYNYLYFGFTTSGSIDTFTIAGSQDAVNWTNLGGTWPTCGNGTPCAVNAPSAVCYNNNLYLLMAESNDASLNSSFQDIGVLNTDLSVTTLLTFSWSSLGSVSTIFAGNWDKATGFTNCFETPVTFTTGYFQWSTYAACASLSPTSASITSGPTLVTTSGSPSGNGGYDPQVIQEGSGCFLIQTDTTSGTPTSYSAISSGNCPDGPYAFQTNSSISGSPLGGQLTVSTRQEGPNYLQTTVTGGWYFWFEAVGTPISNGQMYYANCTPISISSCAIGVPQPWIEDHQYRHGAVLKMSSTPLPASTLYGGTLYGGTAQ